MHVTQLLLGAIRRPLTAKQGNKNYYKGNRSGRMGTFTQKGHFIPQNHKKRQFVAPAFDGELKCYVSTKIPTTRNDFNVVHYFKNSENEYLKLEAKKCYKEMFTRGVLKYNKK